LFYIKKFIHLFFKFNFYIKNEKKKFDFCHFCNKYINSYLDLEKNLRKKRKRRNLFTARKHYFKIKEQKKNNIKSALIKFKFFILY